MDASTADQPITVSLRLTDDLSGFGPGASVSGYFFGPSQFQVVSFHLDWTARVSGDAHDGVYESALLVPKLSAPGIWTLAEISVGDAANNSTQLDLGQLLDQGVLCQFTVQGSGDMTAPQLVDLQLSPTNLDASMSAQALTVTAHVSDDIVGIGPLRGSVAMSFSSPSRNQSIAVSLDRLDRASGDSLDGYYSRTILLPKLSETGAWTFDRMDLVDAVGNRKVLYSADLIGLGLPTYFTVTGAGDAAPPDIVELEISPAFLDASIADQAITITVRVIDDLVGLSPFPGSSSGFQWGPISMTFSSPSQTQTVSVDFEWTDRVSGGLLDSTYMRTMLLPQGSESGVWTLEGVDLTDALHNREHLDLLQALQLGLPYQFTVVNRPSLRIAQLAQGVLLSWPVSATGFALQFSDELSPAATWSDLPATPITVGQEQFVVVTPSGTRGFYRLKLAP